MLKGIVIKPLKRNNDERGSFAEILRTDWKDLLIEDQLAQANLSTTYPGVVRAWHRHVRGQTDCFLILIGAVKICAYDEKTRELDEIVSTGKDLQIVRVPGQYWHGFKVIGNQEATLVYFTTRLYDCRNPDEERRPWNDKAVVPRTINGSKGDSRVGKPWNWEHVAYR